MYGNAKKTKLGWRCINDNLYYLQFTDNGCRILSGRAALSDMSGESARAIVWHKQTTGFMYNRVYCCSMEEATYTESELETLRTRWTNELEKANEMDDDLSIKQARDKLGKINDLLNE